MRSSYLAVRCMARTCSGRGCTRPGNWRVTGDRRSYCWQHAVILIRERGIERVLTHAHTGEQVSPEIKPLAIDRAPLPVGVPAIVAELDRARTVRAFNRCRRAVIEQLADCHHQVLGLKPEIHEGLSRARQRIGIDTGGPL